MIHFLWEKTKGLIYLTIPACFARTRRTIPNRKTPYFALWEMLIPESRSELPGRNQYPHKGVSALRLKAKVLTLKVQEPNLQPILNQRPVQKIETTIVCVLQVTGQRQLLLPQHTHNHNLPPS